MKPILQSVVSGFRASLTGFRGRSSLKRRKIAAVFVENEARLISPAKLPVFAELLRQRLDGSKGMGLSPRAKAAAVSPDRKLEIDFSILERARKLKAAYALLVVIHDVSCQVDESRRRPLPMLRVNTTFCTAYQIADTHSGRVLIHKTFALARTTSPIVAGTEVGSDVIDALLAEVANHIAKEFELLEKAAEIEPIARPSL